MVDADILKYLAPLGVGGILAGIMFVIYRKDAIQWQEAWKGQSQMLVQVVKENTAAITAFLGQSQMLNQVVRENTAVVTALIQKLDERRRMDREEKPR